MSRNLSNHNLDFDIIPSLVDLSNTSSNDVEVKDVKTELSHEGTLVVFPDKEINKKSKSNDKCNQQIIYSKLCPECKEISSFSLSLMEKFVDDLSKDIEKSSSIRNSAYRNYSQKLARQLVEHLKRKSIGVEKCKYVNIVKIGALKDMKMEKLDFGCQCAWDPKCDLMVNMKFIKNGLFVLVDVIKFACS